ncbi:MAG: hypothetical protein Q4B29_03110 [Candidatus Saccharibacteria bacterium]|nr:hypothetical protein [Candidatus Saccharibacteria bacterium]
MMIIIKDADTNESWSFVPDQAGFTDAFHKIAEIKESGHAVSGDTWRVQGYFNDTTPKK